MQSDRMLCYEFIAAHPADAARILERLGREDAAGLLQEAPPAAAAGAVKLMAPPTAAWCLENMEVAPCAALVAHLPIDIAALLMRRVAADKRLAILEALADERAEALRRVLRYPEGTAGAMMNPNVCTIPEDLLVQEAIEHLRQHSDHVIDIVFVLNRDHLLIGFVSVAQLLFAAPDERVLSIAQRIAGSLSPTTTQQGILVNPLWQEVHTLPVTDEQGVFLGAIDYHTLRQLERTTAEKLLADRRLDAGTALGELYWIGLSSFIRGMVAVGNRSTSEPHA